MLALLVLIAVACIFIEVEFAIGPAVDAKLEGPRGILCGVLDLRAHGKDRTCPHKQRHAIERRIRFDLLAAVERLARPEVVPSRCRWKINTSLCRVGFEYRIDQDGRPEHELVA